MSEDIAAFATEQLGHTPKDPALFEAALTHSSSRGDNYERLEFLGDRVLGLVMARWLYERFPTEPEGNLSRRFNTLVDRVTCSDVGREIGLPAMIRLGKQARDDGANWSDNVVGDVVESLIGAVYLEGGLDEAEALIRRLGNPNIYYVFPGYSGYTPLGIFQGPDVPPGDFDGIFASGFEPA